MTDRQAEVEVEELDTWEAALEDADHEEYRSRWDDSLKELRRIVGRDFLERELDKLWDESPDNSDNIDLPKLWSQLHPNGDPYDLNDHTSRRDFINARAEEMERAEEQHRADNPDDYLPPLKPDATKEERDAYIFKHVDDFQRPKGSHHTVLPSQPAPDVGGEDGE